MEAAETAARQALDLDRTGTRPKMLLGLVLLIQYRFTDEAEHSLRKAESDFPEAHLLLAHLFWARGTLNDSREKINEYLRSGDTLWTPLATAWLKRLDKAQRVVAQSR